MGILSYNNNNFLNTTFDYVIVDEAARSTAMELLIPIIRGKKIILVSDHKQISPQIESNILKRLEEEENVSQLELETIYNKSLFGIMYELANPKLKTLLNKQFRMHSDISSIVSKLFYNSTISDGINVSYNTHGIEERLDRSFYWVDTDFTSDSYERKNENMSFYKLNCNK